MNRKFINKIYEFPKALLMQLETEEFLAELEACDVEEYYPRSFELYEEYSQQTMTDTIKTCRKTFEKADKSIRRELLIDVGREIKSFHIWLEEFKNLQPTFAHYYSISIKGVLLGLPMGIQLAQAFSVILDTQIKK